MSVSFPDPPASVSPPEPAWSVSLPSPPNRCRRLRSRRSDHCRCRLRETRFNRPRAASRHRPRPRRCRSLLPPPAVERIPARATVEVVVTVATFERIVAPTAKENVVATEAEEAIVFIVAGEMAVVVGALEVLDSEIGVLSPRKPPSPLCCSSADLPGTQLQPRAAQALAFHYASAPVHCRDMKHLLRWSETCSPNEWLSENVAQDETRAAFDDLISCLTEPRTSRRRPE